MPIALSRIPTAIRREVYDRDDRRCILCGDDRSIHLHHVRHRSQGGQSVPENLVCLCPACHAVAHGEWEKRHDFPFDKDTALHAILWYLYETIIQL